MICSFRKRLVTVCAATSEQMLKSVPLQATVLCLEKNIKQIVIEYLQSLKKMTKNVSIGGTLVDLSVSEH